MTDSSLNLLSGTVDLLILKSLTWEAKHGYSISEWIDSVTIEFKLREDVTFTNGEAFNADTVLFSFDQLLDPEIGGVEQVNQDRIETELPLQSVPVTDTTPSKHPPTKHSTTNRYQS